MIRISKRLRASALIAAFAAGAIVMNESAGAQAAAGFHTSRIQTASAKRFKRGIKRTTKKIRHFIRRASGKH